MEFLILLGAILLAGLGIVIWFRVSDEWTERDEFRRFQEAMRAPGMRPLDLDRDDHGDPRRPE